MGDYIALEPTAFGKSMEPLRQLAMTHEKACHQRLGRRPRTTTLSRWAWSPPLRKVAGGQSWPRGRSERTAGPKDRVAGTAEGGRGLGLANETC